MVETMVKKYRGYWCTHLIAQKGPYNKRVGILHSHCTKVGNKYIVKEA